MKKISAVSLFLIMFISGAANAQLPLVGPPVKLDIGIGGGPSLPLGTLSDLDNTGWHAGAIGRISGFIPLNLVASVNYNRLPNKAPLAVPAVLPQPSSRDESDIAWMAAAGIEYPIPSLVVKPYFALDAMLNAMSNTAQDSKSIKRGGLGFGAGVGFSVPMIGTFDASVKYQIFNLVGKDEGEETQSQVVANVALMFSIL